MHILYCKPIFYSSMRENIKVGRKLLKAQDVLKRAGKFYPAKNLAQLSERTTENNQEVSETDQISWESPFPCLDE